MHTKSKTLSRGLSELIQCDKGKIFSNSFSRAKDVSGNNLIRPCPKKIYAVQPQHDITVFDVPLRQKRMLKEKFAMRLNRTFILAALCRSEIALG